MQLVEYPSKKSQALGMTKGKGDGCMESGCWTEAFLITLDRPQAQEQLGRDEEPALPDHAQ
jgi:hypothetical protein